MSQNQSVSFYGPISRPICGCYRQIEQSVVYIILKIMLLRRLELLDWVELCTFRTYLNQCDLIHGKNDMPLLLHIINDYDTSDVMINPLTYCRKYVELIEVVITVNNTN